MITPLIGTVPFGGTIVDTGRLVGPGDFTIGDNLTNRPGSLQIVVAPETAGTVEVITHEGQLTPGAPMGAGIHVLNARQVVLRVAPPTPPPPGTWLRIDGAGAATADPPSAAFDANFPPPSNLRMDVEVDLDDWSAGNPLLTAWGPPGAKSFYFAASVPFPNQLIFIASTDGTAETAFISDPVVIAGRKWVRVNFFFDAGSSLVFFSQSNDGVVFTDIGVGVPGAGIPALFDSTAANPVRIGSDGTTSATGNFYRARLASQAPSNRMLPDFTNKPVGEFSFLDNLANQWRSNGSGALIATTPPGDPYAVNYAVVAAPEPALA